MVLDDAWNRTTQLSGHAGVLPVHITAFILAIANFLLNSFICLAFCQHRYLFNKCHLYIFFAFAMTNCWSEFTGFFSQPTLINLFLHNNLNCPRWTIMIGSVFEIGLDRLRKILTIGIAVERLCAVYLPSRCYLMDHYKFASRFCILGSVWGFCDSLAMSLEDSIYEVRMHCVTTASSGPYFHAYFLISSIIMGAVLLITYSFFVIKLSLMTESLTICRNNLRAQAIRENNRQVYYLLHKTRCQQTIHLFKNEQSIFLNFYYSSDFSYFHLKIIFMDAGPVITIGNHLYGCSSFFIYNWRHRDIRSAIM
ncbi:unnamed protein product [Thelazia callipaeda]|uniref:G_PROTEIN_RECEP_F1_2 domain-containing protein n=1 Tax=Thelazia callipaeda TaxID=103827 RepID=A0A0N5CV26_THECL|nr:unnamed protein product [Thelazia callipaeda]